MYHDIYNIHKYHTGLYLYISTCVDNEENSSKNTLYVVFPFLFPA